MASSEVEMSSFQSFNWVLSPHERCIRGDNNHNKKKNSNNVRNIHVAFEKNLNVFVKDHLEICRVSSENGDHSTTAVSECSSNKSSVSEHRLSKTEESRHEVPSSSSLGADPDPNFNNPGQPDKNSSKNETRAASSLVQIWEARTTQQPPSSNQNQSQIDSITSSSGSNLLGNSEFLSEESVKEYDLIQPIKEGHIEEEEEEEMESDSQFVPPSPVSGVKEREGVRVMDIIRKLSNDSETTVGNDNGEEVQTAQARSFPQVACTPRIRGRQAFADLLMQMTLDREKELACLLDRHSVSKFTHRGRIQSTLRIRCYERCIAIQDRHRSKSSAAGSDLNRSPKGSGVRHLLKEKYKTNSENIETGAPSTLVSSRGRIIDKDPHKASEKKFVEETMEESDVKEDQEVISVTETTKKGVLREIVENKNGLKKSTGETTKKENAESRGEKREIMNKNDAREGLEGRAETAKKAVWTESAEDKSGLKKSARETLQKETTEGSCKKGETKHKAISKENVQGNASVGIAEKVNIWNSEEKMNRRRWTENGKNDNKANTERVEKKDVFEEATKRTINVENAERSITTSRETMAPCEFTEKVVRRKKKEDCVSVETKFREIEDPQQVTAQEEEKVLQETTTNSVLSETRNNKNGLKKPTEKEIREGRGERREMEESREGNTLMGIAEKVNLWNSKERKNRRRVMEKGKGKTEDRASAERYEVLQEASRRIINVETAETSLTTSKETVVGTQDLNDKRESSREIMRCESEDKGRRKKEEELSFVGVKSKDIIEVKNMNSQEVTPAQESVSHGFRERAKEINSSQQGEEMVILRNPEARSTKEIDRNSFQENRTEEESASGGSRERAKENDSSQQDEEMSTMPNPNDFNGNKESEDEKTNNMKEAATEFVNDWDENEMEEDEDDDYGDYDHYNDENSDWIYDISRPRHYWEELRKERYLEVLNTESEKKDICDLIQSRTVSNFLTSDLRQKIDNLMITRGKIHFGVPINQEEDEEEEEWVEDCSAMNQEDNETEEEPEKTILEAEWIEECSARNQEDNETEEKPEKTVLEAEWIEECSARNQEDNETEEEPEKTILEADWVEECSARNQEDNETEEEPEKTILEDTSDGCSQSSTRSSTLIISWSFRDQDIDKDHETSTSSSLPEPSVPTNQSTQEMQMISDLKGQMEQLQREVLQLRNSVTSCIDRQLHFQKSVTQDLSRSGSSGEQRVDTKNPLKRKCCVCSEMPVDSLLYRCGHMCTCLKCAHELQWSSKKCPICMAPIVDVVRAFLS